MIAVIATLAIVSYAYSQKNVVVFADNTGSPNSSLPSYQKTPEGLKELVSSYNSKYGKILYALANCESGFKDICIMDTNNKLSCGIFMFQRDTFYGHCSGSWLNPYDELKCADKMIGEGRLHTDWVNCGKRIDTI